MTRCFPPMTPLAASIVATAAAITAVIVGLNLGVYPAAGVILGSVIHAALWSWVDDRRARLNASPATTSRTEIHS